MRKPRRSRSGSWVRNGAVAAAVPVLLGILVSVPVSAPSRAEASSASTPPFSVYKNTIVDAHGNPFFMRGAGSPSLTWSCTGLKVDQSIGPIPASDFVAMATAWDANTVTIYVNQDYWMDPSLLDSYGHSCADYRSVVQQAVSDAEGAGLQVILGPPVSDGGSSTPTGLWCGSQVAGSACIGQWCMPDENTNVLWQSLAEAFGSDPSVFFELYAEPHNVSWTIWKNGGPITCNMKAASSTTAAYTYTAAGMQQLVNTIRATGAENIVLAGGTSWAYNLSGVPSHFLTGGNIGYSTHIYSSRTTTWAKSFDDLAASAPVVATELGDKASADLKSCTSSTFVSTLMTNLNANGIGYTAYAWIQPGFWPGSSYSVGCMDQALIQNPSGLCISDGCEVQSNSIGLSTGALSVTVPAWTPIPGTDAYPPTTTLTAPASGATLSGSAALTAGAADAAGGITNVEFRLSGGPPGQTVNERLIASGVANNSSYSASWNTATVPNGTYTLQSVAYDAAGGMTFSSGITVTISN